MIYCKLYKTECSVNETFADEYPTPCHSCNSGKGKSHKVHYIVGIDMGTGEVIADKEININLK